MLDTSYAEYRETVYRLERLPERISDIVNDPNISAMAAVLLLWMIDKPRRWRFLVAHIITVRNADGRRRFGGRDKVRALLRAHSLIPGQPAGTFDPKWGFGLIDLSQIARTLDLQKEPARMVMGGPRRLAGTL